MAENGLIHTTVLGTKADYRDISPWLAHPQSRNPEKAICDEVADHERSKSAVTAETGSKTTKIHKGVLGMRFGGWVEMVCVLWFAWSIFPGLVIGKIVLPDVWERWC